MSDPSLYADALALAGGYAFETGEDGHLDFADRAMLAQRLGLDGADDLDTGAAGWTARLSIDDAATRDAAYAGLTEVGSKLTLDYTLNSEGAAWPVREIAVCTASADGRATLVRGVLLDRSGEAQTAWRLRHDPLTRLPNRVTLEEMGAQLAGLSERIGIPAHLLRLRIRNLDDLTKSFGPAVRGQLLGEAAKRLQSALRVPDIAARLDGPDFAAATLNSDPDTLGLRLRAAVSTEPCETEAGPLALELDVTRASLTTVDEALRALDGKAAPKPARTDLPSVDDAVAGDVLSLAFQPIVHADGHALHHFEALLRLRGPNGQVASAFPFIAKAEASGEVHRLDRYVLDLAANQLQADETLHLAVNVSAGTVGDPQHSEAYVAALQSLGETASRLTLELTETLAVDDPALATHFSAQVRALGCRFAVDDFASGHTSFRNLLAVDADCIKIDGSLVRGVALDENKQAFIRVMVDLAATFGVETVAEMVEDRADARVLSDLGVTYLQGYHFGRPGPAPVWDRPAA